MRSHFMLGLIGIMFITVSCTGQKVKTEVAEKEPGRIVRYDRPDYSILKGVSVPADKKIFFSSGLVALPSDTTAPDASLERFGDTYTQSVACLNRVESVLNEAGLELKDVIYLGVFIAPDPRIDNQIEFDSWFKAYAEFFNTEDNPVKTARTTLGVASLARPYFLVEVECIAVYP